MCLVTATLDSIDTEYFYQVAAQEGGGGGAPGRAPISSAPSAECWDRSTSVLCLHKHHQPPEPTDALCIFNFAHKLQPPGGGEEAEDLASPPFLCIPGILPSQMCTEEARLSALCTQG